MPLTRRTLLLSALSTLPALSLMGASQSALADETANTVPNSFTKARTLGNPQAKVHVQEWFSLTCVHCGRFAKTVFPEIQKKYIDTGKVFYIFKDYPLDKIALNAAIAARSLPVDQYKPFVFALLSSLDQWAFQQTVDPMEALQKYATLAGMSKERFEQVTHDVHTRDIILKEMKYGEDHYKIDSTPTFIFNGKPVIGELTLEQFDKAFEDALNRPPSP